MGGIIKASIRGAVTIVVTLHLVELLENGIKIAARKYHAYKITRGKKGIRKFYVVRSSTN